MWEQHVIKSTDDNNDDDNKVHIPVTAGSRFIFIDPFETSNFNSGFGKGTVLLIKHEEYHNSDIVPEEEENMFFTASNAFKELLLLNYKGN